MTFAIDMNQVHEYLDSAIEEYIAENFDIDADSQEKEYDALREEIFKEIGIHYS